MFENCFLTPPSPLTTKRPRLLELFSGTHSVGKVASKLGYDVVSLDRDMGAECPFNSGYISPKHHKCDIMDFDYKQYPPNSFDIITASPVCAWWSILQYGHIGRFLKRKGRIFTREDIDEDIEEFGVPMVDKLFEIIDYLKPTNYWIENPATGKMKEYIPDIIPYHDVDYCKYGFLYKKRTRIWTNIKFEGRLCKKDCSSILTFEDGSKIHPDNLGNAKQTKKIKSHPQSLATTGSRHMRYRLPPQLVYELLCDLNY